MGALLVYLVAQQLVARRLPLPVHIFVSGHRAPSVESRSDFKHNLPKTEFIAMLQRLGGCPPEILQDAELLNFFEASANSAELEFNSIFDFSIKHIISFIED